MTGVSVEPFVVQDICTDVMHEVDTYSNPEEEPAAGLVVVGSTLSSSTNTSAGFDGLRHSLN